MIQNIFETRQRAAELLEEAVRIWRSSEKNEYLEGLENDPVFKMLINALAYQANELESDIALLKDEILEEFESFVSRGEAGKALPAVVTVEAPLAGEVNECNVNSGHDFFFKDESGTTFSFSPLFRTKAMNVRLKAISRIDARRWRVSLSFADKVSNLSGLSFVINDYTFFDLSVTLEQNGKRLAFAAPWNYANYPMADYFSLSTFLFNRMQGVNSSSVKGTLTPYLSYTANNLYSSSDSAFFIFMKNDDFAPTSDVDLVFEFSGIPTSFTFDFNSIHFNCIVLVNASARSVSLSTSSPLVKLTGGANGGVPDSQFLYLLPPRNDDTMDVAPIQVRRIRAERFNEGRLFKLLNNLIIKYHSDYYAFESIGTESTDAIMRQIQKCLSTLIHSAKEKMKNVNPGVYAILDIHKSDSENTSGPLADSNTSVDVNYLVTEGAGINRYLNMSLKLSAPQEFNQDLVKVVIPPAEGYDQITGKKEERVLTRYYLTTEDRIVTPYDMRMFCYTELITRYGLVDEMIEDITVGMDECSEAGFHIFRAMIRIVLKSNDFTRRAFSDKTEIMESYLRRMISVRTDGLYPVRVSLSIGES